MNEQLKGAFCHFNGVAQPFLSLIDPAVKEKVMQVAGGGLEMDSILNCHYKGKVNVFGV